MRVAPPTPWLWPWLGLLVVDLAALVWVLTTPTLRPRRPTIPRQRDRRAGEVVRR